MTNEELKAKTLLLSALAYLEKKAPHINALSRYNRQLDEFCYSLDELLEEILALDERLYYSKEFKCIIELANRVNEYYGNDLIVASELYWGQITKNNK